MSDSLDDPSGLRQSIQNTGLGKVFFLIFFCILYMYIYIYIYIAIYWDEQLMMLTIVENFSKPGPYSTTIVHSTVPLSSTISSYCNVLRSTVYHIISHHIISYHIIRINVIYIYTPYSTVVHMCIYIYNIVTYHIYKISHKSRKISPVIIVICLSFLLKLS